MAKKIPQPHWWAINRFEPWESWNPNGKPKKIYSTINAELAKEWYPPVTKAQIEEGYMSMMNVDEEKLKEMVNDKKMPMSIRVIIKSMLSWKGFDIIEKILDRGIGKPDQKNKHEIEEIKTIRLNVIDERPWDKNNK